MEHNRKSAAESFEEIKQGGRNLLVAAQGRLIEAKHALEEGRFTDSAGATQSAFAKINALAEAEQALGVMSKRVIIRVKDVQPGMVVPDVGPIEAVAPCRCEVENCQKVELTIGGEAQRFMGDQEMLVEIPETPSDG